MDLAEQIEQLNQRKATIRDELGGRAQVERQHAAGKLTARERVERLLDPGSFVEWGILGHSQSSHPDIANRPTPADGVVTGVGRIDGRIVCLAAYDFTVMGGSMGVIGERKVARLRRHALMQRVPMIWLLDSAGARIQEYIGSTFASTGDLFYEEVIMSGVVPLVGALLGPTAAGTAYVPTLSDFVPMVKGIGSMAIGGIHLVKAVVGEDVDVETLGGAKVHCELSGTGDLEVPDDAACLQAIRDFLSYLPSHNQEAPPVRPTADPAERRAPELYKILPASSRRAYDMHRVIKALVDDGVFFPMKGAWAKNLITGFARLGGQSVGLVANQPMHLGGVIDVDAADKAARFMNLCDSFNVPLIFLMDTPGFMVGTKVEQEGILRSGAKMLAALATATVPKLTVIARKAYGAGYYVMCGKGFEPDLLVAWPTAEISVMGPEGGVGIVYRKEIAQAADPEAMRQQKIEEFRQLIDPYVAAGHALIDDVIDPADTRATLINGLALCAGKRVERPWKKHANVQV